MENVVSPCRVALYYNRKINKRSLSNNSVGLGKKAQKLINVGLRLFDSVEYIVESLVSRKLSTIARISTIQLGFIK